MESRAKFLGHPIHPMLIVFPLGLLGTSVIFDVIRLLGGSELWSTMAFYLIAAGLIGGLVAAVFGFWDWVAIPDSRAKRIGLWHALANVVVMALFFVSWLLRRDDPVRPETLALLLSFGGMAVSLLSGWLGGELVYRLRVGVDEHAHLNAPSSLSSDSPEAAGRSTTAWQDK